MVAAIDLSSPNEVYLGDTYFPIRGGVRFANLTVPPVPTKVGQGDNLGQTQLVADFSQAHARGGPFLYRADFRTQGDRSWYSELDTRFNFFVLPPLHTNHATDVSFPSGAAPDRLMEFHGGLYMVGRPSPYTNTTRNLYKTTNGTTWSASLHTWTAPRALAYVPAHEVYKDKLYIATGSSLEVLTNADVPSSQATATYYLRVFANVLYKLDYATATRQWTLSSATDGVTWTSKATLPDGFTATGMVVWRDPTGALALYVTTSAGLFIYDATNTVLNPTDVMWARYEPYQSGATNTDGLVGVDFIPAGYSPAAGGDGRLYIKTSRYGIIAIQAGNPFVVTPVGFDRDDGTPDVSTLPKDDGTDTYQWGLMYPGVVALAPTPTSVLATVNMGAHWDTSGPGFTPFVSGCLYEYIAGAWHSLYSVLAGSSLTQGYNMLAPNLLVSSLFNANRIYLAQPVASFIVSIPQSTTLYNPRLVTTRSFKTGCTHVTPWYDFGSRISQKTIPRLVAWSRNCSANQTIKVLYATNLDDSTWTLLGTINTNGFQTLKFAAGVGVTARYWRFAFSFGTSVTTTSPILDFWDVEFITLIPAEYGFAFEVNLTGTHRNLSAYQLWQALIRLTDPAQTTNLISFAYEDDLAGIAQTYIGRIQRITGLRQTGREHRGKGNFLVSFVVPHPEDAV